MGSLGTFQSAPTLVKALRKEFRNWLLTLGEFFPLIKITDLRPPANIQEPFENIRRFIRRRL